MGIWMYMFSYSKWEEMYVKNCSLKTPDEWNLEGYANAPLGTLYLTLGIFCELIYIPFLIVMARKEFFQHSSYKFMFLIGVLDLITLPCIAIITGVQCILGMHFCNYPAFFFFVGSIGSAGWYSVSLTCVILAVDRIAAMCWPNLSKALFSGNRPLFWMIVPIVYFFLTFLDTPFLYNTKRFIYFTDPYVMSKNMEGNPAFHNLTFHCAHNISAMLLIGGIYVALVVIVKIQSTNIGDNQRNVVNKQKLMTLQAACICIEMFFGTVVYIYNQFLPLPNILEIIAHVSWIGVHGDTPLVYLALNKSLRQAVFKLMKTRSSNTNNTVHVVENDFRNTVPTSGN